MASEEGDPGYAVLPPQVFEEGSAHNGFDLDAHFDMLEGANQGDTLSARFASNEDVLSSTNPERNVVEVYASLVARTVYWRTNVTGGAPHSLQASAGATLITDPASYYATPPDELVSSIPEASVHTQGSNTLTVRVRGTQAEVLLNGTPLGFLNYDQWPKMRYVHAIPDKEGVFGWGSYHLTALHLERFIPPVAWGMFGFAAFGALASVIAAAASRS